MSFFLLQEAIHEQEKTGYKVGKKSRQEALEFCKWAENYLKKAGIPLKDVVRGGSIRRKKSEVGDIDFGLFNNSVNKSTYDKIVDMMKKDGTDVEIKRKGNSLCSLVVDREGNRFLVEFKKLKPEAKGAGLLHLTGSGDFNYTMRAQCKANGMRLSEAGLKDDKGNFVGPQDTEQDIFKTLGVPYIPPEKRNGKFPYKLKGESQIKTGGFHKLDIPKDITNKLPSNVIKELATFKLPEYDETGVKVPSDFLWNKNARQSYYRRRGKLKISDSLKLDRY